MNYKTLAEDAIEVAKNASQSGIAADHMARANVYATLYLAEQQNMANRMQYAIDFATGDEHFAELGREIGAALGGTQPAAPHECETCPDCIHDGAKCCGCYDGLCCREPEELGVTA